MNQDEQDAWQRHEDLLRQMSTTGRVENDSVLPSGMAVIKEAPAAAITPRVYLLSGADRCDSCGSRAYIRATMGTGELYFCGHHGHQHEAVLKPKSLVWLDESDNILNR